MEAVARMECCNIIKCVSDFHGSTFCSRYGNILTVVGVPYRNTLSQALCMNKVILVSSYCLKNIITLNLFISLFFA